MNPSHIQSTYAAVRSIAAAALVAAIGFASAPAVSAPATGADRIESRIHDMHAKLKITAAQEDQWKAVAQVMRDNEAALDPLVMDRKKNAATMSAMDDLKSYSDITDAHAQGIKKFIPAFGTLYAAMSDPQKKEADSLFRHGSGKMKGK
jgi:protein CpxP